MKKSDMICTIKIKDKAGRVIGTKEVVKYEGLLAKAHDEGLKRISTQLVQAPLKDNDHTAVVQVSVETQKGVFDGIGDANPGNVTEKMVPHLIRMAETRAKARALRDAVNIATVSIEELVSDLENEAEESVPVPGDSDGGNGNGNGGKAGHSDPENGNGNGKKDDPAMTDAQRRFLFRLLAKQGLEGEKAREHLLQVFRVTELSTVTKREASKLIDTMQRSQTAQPEA